MPASVTVPAGATSRAFTVTTVRPSKNTAARITATYAGSQTSVVLKVTAR